MTPPVKKAAPSSLKDLLANDKPEETDPPIVDETGENLINPEEKLDSDDNPEDDDNFLSPHVVATVPNKTPAELASESPEETAARYGVDTSISDADADNPRVQVYRDTRVEQVPAGTHLHPDIAKSLQNRGITEMHTDNALVRHPDTAPTYDFAPDAEVNDKWVKPPVEDNEE